AFARVVLYKHRDTGKPAGAVPPGLRVLDRGKTVLLPSLQVEVLAAAWDRNDHLSFGHRQERSIARTAISYASPIISIAAENYSDMPCLVPCSPPEHTPHRRRRARNQRGRTRGS